MLLLARSAIGTVIGRSSVSKGRVYTRLWIYVPTKVSDDTAFPFRIGEPCMVELDLNRRRLVISPISKEEARKQGWRERQRKISR